MGALEAPFLSVYVAECLCGSGQAPVTVKFHYTNAVMEPPSSWREEMNLKSIFFNKSYFGRRFMNVCICSLLLQLTFLSIQTDT